ncbi:phospholipase A-2-activating protein [Panus rudis PR-1116 ss-1]|nr:phospholipase A-2-activating protein [Panus rudis PR-1116 ss-1]
MPYRLSTSLVGHKSDVRAVCSPRDDLILSASRDTTAITWTRPSNNDPFTQSLVLRPGTRFVSSVAYIPPSPDAPEGFAVTGGQDGIINVYSLANRREEPDFRLLGHQQNVCALDAAPDGTIISGSWDQTARVWKNFQLAYELLGHGQSVWAVIAIDPNQFLTGSADNTIKLWHGHKAVKTYTGHTQAVRGLALVPDLGFASCANDSEIRVWTMEGDLVYTLTGHTSFVYSLSVAPNGYIVSGGEDRSVRIWRDGECIQNIVHPAISVWAVSTMPNNDIVTGCSDGVVRVFSTAPDRWASPDEVQAFEQHVASQAIPKQTIGNVKVADLPGPDALLQPGTKPGEYKMVNNHGTAEIHEWDNIEGKWKKIGDITDTPGSEKKTVFEGKEYDYVIDVVLEDGVPPLKLPFNAGDNPYIAAQRFLERHELPMHFLDQIVKFIEANTGAVSLGSSPQYSDPFTGASRYQATQSNATATGQEFADPFTGASRYRAPSSGPQSGSSPTSANDPWTGGSRHSASSPTPQTPTSAKIPVRSPHLFLQCNISAMQTKLYQFNDVLASDVKMGMASMYTRELNFLDEIFAYLTKVSATPPLQPNTEMNANHLDVIMGLLEKWPPEQRFPVLDLARLIIAYAPQSYADPGLRDRFFNSLFDGAEWSQPWTLPLAKYRESNIQFLLRALANTFQDKTPLGNGSWVKVILQKLREAPYSALNKTHRMALSTILFNLSCRGIQEKLDPELFSQHLQFVLEVLTQERSDAEAAYRALVALGNVLYASKQWQQPLNGTQSNTARSILQALPSRFGADARVRSLSHDVITLL